MTGTWVLLVALALSVAAGLIHRRSDGRLRSVRKPGNATASRSVQPGGPADSRTDQGAPDPEPASPEPAASPTPEPGDLRPLLIGLGLTPGVSATLVQFSSAFCAPCRSTRRILTEVSELVPGVVHLEIDAESQLALVRQLKIRKTPTTLVLDATGHEVKRATGAPRKADVIAAVGSAVLS